jgi:uncharacterized protein YdeI (YjbR/CyaY-like superfamily)
MEHFDKKVDKYIEKSAEFAKPILNHLRKLVHEACPEVTEAIKWSFPTFNYKGMLCDMAAFKNHCTFGFWKHQLMEDFKIFLKNREEGGMGSFGKITSLDELPPDDQMIGYIREAVKLNEEGAKLPRKKTPKDKTMEIPAFFSDALGKNTAAKKAFDQFSYSKKKDYVDWLTEARSKATREKRLATSLEWLAEGKTRNWKYEKC